MGRMDGNITERKVLGHHSPVMTKVYGAHGRTSVPFRTDP